MAGEGSASGNPWEKAPRLAGCVVGIIGSLMIYGILQERIMTRDYNGEYFNDTVFLVLNNRFAACVCAAIVLLLRKESLSNSAPISQFFLVSISNVTATTCQYEALKYVNFPTQTLGKCAKMIPVMIWGTLISKKKYELTDYAVAVIVTFGAFLFMLTGDLTAGSQKAEQSNSFYGLLLMTGYLGFDGFTSTFQSKLFSSYKMSSYNQMLYVNLCSGLLSLFGLLLSGGLFTALAFVGRNPAMLSDALILSFAAVVGQFVITYTIKEFGALVFATVMTTRQFLSILFSCLLFAHPLTFWQWVGTVMIFAALYYQAFANKHSHGHSKPNASPAPSTAAPAEEKA